LLAAARAERNSLSLTDKLIPHGLDAGATEDLRAQLMQVGGVTRAYLARKRVEHFQEIPVYVLGYAASPWWSWRTAARALEVQKRILADVSFPGESFVVGIEGANRRLGRRLRFMRGARIL
jgi:hypothetical protein